MTNLRRTSQRPEVSAALRHRLADAFASGKTIERNTLTSAESRALEEAGRITFQVGLRGQGLSVRVANLSPWENGEGDLRHVLIDYLADANVPDAHKRAARTVVRFLTDAPDQCSENTLLTAASRVTAAQLHGLASSVEVKAAEVGLSGQTRRNYKATISKIVRYGSERALVPLVWPLTKLGDAWEEVAASLPIREKCRSLLITCRPHFMDMLGENGTDPRRLTKEQVDAVCKTLRSRGQYREARSVSELIGRAAKFGIGPSVVTESSLGIEWPDGEGPAMDTPAGLIALLRARGYPDSLIEAMEYHADQCLLSDDDLAMKGGLHPVRRIRPQILVTTYRAHARAMRRLLGIVELRAKWKQEETTPEKLFDSLHVFIAHLKRDWERRAERDLVTGPATGALALLVYAWGMVAETLRGRAAHERTRLSEDPEGTQQQFMKVARAEAIFTRARDVAYSQSEGIRDRIGDSPAGSEKNTRKDIKEVYARTPPSYWLRTLRAMLIAVESNRRANRCNIEALLTEQMALALALVIATGMRWAELCHVRLDIHFTPAHRANREIVLRAIDRKNLSRHTVSLSENVVPAWLLSDFLLRVRTHLLRSKDHPWLFVLRNGRPVGCLGETADARDRDLRLFEGRRNGFRALWQDIVAPFAYAANGHCPAESGQFTPHCIRNVFGAELVKRHGIDKAAHWLGDHPNSVRETYGFLDGKASEIAKVTDDLLAEIYAREE